MDGMTRMEMAMSRRVLLVVGLLTLSAVAGVAESPRYTDAFPPEEFAARRARVFDAIGDGLAVLQGASDYPAYVKFRQNNQFFYLTGVEVPRALLLLDGRTKTTTLFVPPRNERMERSEGPILVPGDEAARLTGIPQVLERDKFAEALKAAATPGRTLYVPHRPEVLAAGTPRAAVDAAEAVTKDPWDGRPSRAAQFVEKLKAAVPGIAVKDLDPALDELRLVKSPREIALVREATRLAGVAISEAIRSARPGQHEHDLEAVSDYVFKQGGAQGFAYFALAATGSNAFYPHYHGGRAELKAGDLVLFDYAPDYKYYTSDVTRMFPASGRFSAEQKERYTVYLRLYAALMTSIKPGVAPRDVIRDAVVKMDAIVAAFGFSSEVNRDAAKAFVDRYRASTRNSLGHMVGMEVHDVQPAFDVLKPGMIFTIEPALTVPDERVYIRLEDVILITETGYENLSGFLPVEPEAIEALMAEHGRFEDQPPARGTK
jgi:Xaa-Pro aminopeptidase